MINRGFAETMALKRSAGLETVACWQTDAQWTEREVRDQLDALFAHRVYFATASARDARSAVDADDGGVLGHRAPGRRAPVERSAVPTCGCTCPSTTRSQAGPRAQGRQPPFIARDDPAASLIASDSRCTPRDSASAAGAIAPISASHTGIAGAASRADGARHEPAMPSRRSSSRCRRHGQGTPASRERQRQPAPRRRPLPPRERRRGRDATASRGPAESYRELVELDGAHSVRWAKPTGLRADARARPAGPGRCSR